MIKNKYAGSFTTYQKLFLEYIFFILVDLTVLNIYNEFTDKLFLESFSISFLIAVSLQFMLQATMMLEHKVSNYFKSKDGLQAKIFRGLSIWAILFFSKLIILQVLNFVFTDSIIFTGRLDGLVAFAIIIVTMIVAEKVLRYIYKSLGKNTEEEALELL